MSRPTNTPEVPCLVPGCILTGTHDEHESAPGHKITHVWAVISEHPYRERAMSPADYLREIAALPDGQDPATLRARLQERYECPERPCTYDPADEEPEAEPVSRVDIEHRWTNPEAPPLTLRMEYEQADWTPPRPEPLEYSGIPVVVDPEQEEGTVRVVSWTDQTRGFVDSLLDFPAVAPQGGPDPRNTVGGLSKKTFDPTWMDDMPVFRLGTKDKPGGFMTYGEMRKQDDATLPPGTVRAALERTVRDASTHTKEDPMPTTTIIDRAILEEVARDLPKSYASVTGWTNQIVEDPSNGPRMDRSVAKFMERVRSAALLRSYLRTLTNPDATPEGVNAALDALTPEDRALVSEALPSWGSARMALVEAIAPFMDRFETMVRERDPRAHEEGTLLLSALREDDPTRSTVEALMEIAKTPKVNP